MNTPTVPSEAKPGDDFLYEYGLRELKEQSDNYDKLDEKTGGWPTSRGFRDVGCRMPPLQSDARLSSSQIICVRHHRLPTHRAR
ncbi:MAG: hypothetical protein ABSD89_15275 [Halobacteriota archaeon]|jgi:hypothetical protein